MVSHLPSFTIAVASGKGGTGKTTVASSLALSLSGLVQTTEPGADAPLFLDCDVEAPNAHLFLKPELKERKEIGILIPQVDETRCSHCGKCSEVCQYHAIAVLGKKTLVFPQLCHGCGSCTLVCPEGAISEVLDVMGVLERGPAIGEIHFGRGVLDIGEPMAVPVIRQLKAWAKPQPGQWVVIDASPGSSCPVVEAIRGADFLILVTEPTPFGLHDLRLAAEMGRKLDLPAGVVINRDGIGGGSDGFGGRVEAYCKEQGLPVLLRIPFEREIAEGIAAGRNLVEIHPEMRASFIEMSSKIIGLTQTMIPKGALR